MDGANQPSNHGKNPPEKLSRPRVESTNNKNKKNPENRATTPNPYYMKGDSSFKEKLDRLRQTRLPQTNRPSNHKPNVPNTKPKPTSNLKSSTYSEAEYIKSMQELSDRLNKPKASTMTKQEKDEWYIKRGYTLSTNGVLVPPQSLEAMNTVMASNVEQMANIQIRPDSFVEGDPDPSDMPETKLETDCPDAEDSSSSSSMSPQSSCYTSDEEDDPRMEVSPDDARNAYPAKMAIRFLEGDFLVGNQIMDQECYGCYGDCHEGKNSPYLYETDSEFPSQCSSSIYDDVTGDADTTHGGGNGGRTPTSQMLDQHRRMMGSLLKNKNVEMN